MPRPHPCLAPPPAPIAPHHLSTAPLLPAPPRPHRAHRVPPSASLYVATEQIPRSSPPHHDHRAPPPSYTCCASPSASRPPCADIRVTPHLSPRVAAAPGPWPARTAPYASLFRRMREKGPLPGNIRPKCMLFEIRMATSSPHASISGRNRAIQDTWRANLAAKGPFPRRGARNHAWREGVASAARPFRGSGMRSGGTGLAPCGSGMRSGRTGFAPCGAGLACLPHAPPVISLVPAAACAPAISPAFIAAVLHAPRFAVRDPPRGPHADASRYLSAAPIPPAARTHRVQETSGTTQTTQCGHKNRIPKWGPY